MHALYNYIRQVFLPDHYVQQMTDSMILVVICQKRENESPFAEYQSNSYQTLLSSLFSLYRISIQG